MSAPVDEFEQIMLDYLKGDIDPQDMQKLVTLLKEDESCREKYRELSRAYALASSTWFAQRKKQNFEQLRDILNFRSSRKQTFSRRLRVWSAVAVWVLLIGCGIFLYVFRSTDPAPTPVSYCRIEVPEGSTSKLLLPDSTVVFLNGGTVLKYDAALPYKPDRKVYLSGEACFKVAENREKPFIVHAGELNVKVLGTTFNVTSYPDDPEIKVSLVEGHVSVFTDSETSKNIFLLPNEQAVYNKKEKRLSMKKTDAVLQTAWTTGRLVFINEKLSDILQAVGKKHNVQIEIRSHKVYDEYFSGSIDAHLTLDEILSLLDVDNKFVCKKRGKTITITDR